MIRVTDSDLSMNGCSQFFLLLKRRVEDDIFALGDRPFVFGDTKLRTFQKCFSQKESSVPLKIIQL